MRHAKAHARSHSIAILHLKRRLSEKSDEVRRKKSFAFLNPSSKGLSQAIRTLVDVISLQSSASFIKVLEKEALAGVLSWLNG